MNAVKTPARKDMRSIVICDDNATFALLLRYMFAKQGYSVRSAADGNEALSLLKETPADVLLLDLKMPARDGLGVLEAMSSFPKRPYTFVLSARQGQDQKARASALGAHEVWTKPFDAGRLLARIQALAREGRI